MTAAMITQVFILFLLIKTLIELYLDKRNKIYINAHRNEVPRQFADRISLEEHRKAADYTIAQINTHGLFHLIDTIILLVWTVGGGINALAEFVFTFNLSPIPSGLVFFGFFSLISLVLGIPQSLYTTFVLEERFGFNNTTLRTFIVDLVKSIGVGLILGTPVLYGVLSIMETLGNRWWIYAWAFLTLVQFALVWAYPKFIAPLFNKFTELEEGETKDKILSLLKRTGFKSNGLFVMDASRRSSHGNAYFTGFGKNKRIVFFDNLIKSLESEEVESVLAHELGHFKKKHIIKGMVKSIITGLMGFALLGYLMEFYPFYLGHGVQIPTNYTALCLFSMVAGVYTFPMTPLNAWFSRKWEFEADRFAAQYARADKLISALVKLYKDNASTLTPDPVYSAYYHSHPPALIRTEHLEKLIPQGNDAAATTNP